MSVSSSLIIITFTIINTIVKNINSIIIIISITIKFSLFYFIYCSIKENNEEHEQTKNSTNSSKMKRDPMNHDDSINSDAIISRKSKRSLKIPRTFTKDQIVKVGSSNSDDGDDDNCITKNFKYHDHYDSDGKKINNNGIDNHITYINTFTTSTNDNNNNQKDDTDDSKHNDNTDQNIHDKIVSDINNNKSSSSIGNINENIMTVSGNTSLGGERPVSPVGLSRRTTAVKFKAISTTSVGK